MKKEKKKILEKFGNNESVGKTYKHEIRIKEKSLGKALKIKIVKGKIVTDFEFNKRGIKLLKDIEKAGDPMGILDLFKIKKIK